jgi:hypothetical protein
VRHAYARHPQLSSICLLDDFCNNAWCRHVLLDKGIRVTATGVTAIGVTAIRVTAIGVTAIRVTAIRVTAIGVTAIRVTAIGVTAVGVIVVRVTAIGVTAIRVKLEDFEDILCAW